MIKKTIFIIILMFASVYLRFQLIEKPGYTYDVQSFVSWGSDVRDGGLSKLYDKENTYSGYKYPPVVPLLSSLALRIPMRSEAEAFKILPTIFDLLLACLAGFLIIKSKYQHKILLLSIVGLQPAFALVSSGWGQVDSVMTTFIMIGLMLSSASPYLATSFLVLALLTKPQAILAIGIYYLYLYFRFGIKKTAFQLGYFAILIIALDLLFRQKFSISIWSFFSDAVGTYKNLSLNAFNLWWAIYGLDSWNIQDTGQNIPYKAIGLSLFALFSMPSLLYLSKKKNTIDLIFVTGFIYLLFFMFPSQIHERYMFPALAFLAVAPIVDKKLFWSYIILVISFLVNIFTVLQSVYPQFEFLRYNLLATDWTRLVAGINIAVTIYLFVWFCHKDRKLRI